MASYANRYWGDTLPIPRDAHRHVPLRGRRRFGLLDMQARNRPPNLRRAVDRVKRYVSHTLNRVRGSEVD